MKANEIEGYDMLIKDCKAEGNNYLLTRLEKYEIKDANVVSDIDKELLKLITADDDFLPEGKTWACEVARIKKKKSKDAWLYKVPKEAEIVVVKNIETGEMFIRWANAFKTMSWAPVWKYQIVG